LGFQKFVITVRKKSYFELGPNGSMDSFSNFRHSTEQDCGL
jgi:hypothetical protein